MGMVEPAICWPEVVKKDTSDKELDNMWFNFDFMDFPPENYENCDFVGDWSQRLGPIPSDDLLIGTQIIDPLNFLPQTDPIHNDEKYKPKVESSVGYFFPDNPKRTIPGRKRSNRVTSSLIKSPWFSIKLASEKNSIANKSKERRAKRYFSRKIENPPPQVPNFADRQNECPKKCTHCEVTKTPQWREGPLGPKTLCNACGVRYRSGRLFPEYRPAVSPTFVPTIHSNSHKKVVEMRSKGSHTKVCFPSKLSS